MPWNNQGGQGGGGGPWGQGGGPDSSARHIRYWGQGEFALYANGQSA